ncbi:wall-associated receptor kinase-like 14 [Tripterygium wilfordii]|uniref:Wall-associated receptor kinase-like 14 n=1 Tax=Tripterygium wilfordii TaxID=458696 RepID=A0A7J7CWA7_TRIWF|nr:wall-associated receptor kinase-like 14 [Tripterygium wilfordii]KAF5738186.1 wall-associated receptor kinase-like 14 [Tripterygium wilfordii]
MNLHLQPTIFVLVFSTFVVTLIGAHNCSNSCGTGTSARSVQYPFGFSSGCPIRLNCSSDTGAVQIGEFFVHNITPNGILVDLPPKCDRPINSIEPLFGLNYAMAWQNSLLFQNCTDSLNGCVIPTSMVTRRFNSQSCDPNQSNNISCVAQDNKGIDVLSYENVNRTPCAVLFSSISVDSDDSGYSLQFQRIELGWWLSGSCVAANDCDRNANCTSIQLSNGNGYRCRCKPGFEGDGFAAGDGCRKVADCNPSKYMAGRCGGTTRVPALVAGFVAGAVLMALLGTACFFIRRRSTLKDRLSAKRLICEAAGNSSVPFYPYKEIERATNFFSEKQRLGTGAYGTVYAGKLHDEWVAIKMFRHRDTDSIDQVMNEIKLLSSVSHRNLVRLLGCCVEEGEPILIYEFMPNGTLSQHLQRERGKGLPWTIRLIIAAETANAIAYLHSAVNPPIYHRDIKSSNILLDYNYNSKVADFGLSRLGMIESSHISTAPQGTPGYLDPEYHQYFHLSDKSDVYSFGVVLVEIITALKVVDFSRPHSEVNLAALAVDRIGRGCVDEIIDPHLEPHRDAWTLSSIHNVAELAFRCLSYHRDMRPTMMEVAEELERLRLSSWVPTSPAASSCSFSDHGSEASMGGITVKKPVVGSRRLVLPARAIECLPSLEEVKDSSPVSVHDPWLSDQSSPSTSSLLSNVVQ